MEKTTGTGRAKLALASALAAALLALGLLAGCSSAERDSTGADADGQAATSATEQGAGSERISAAISLTSPGGDNKVSYNGTVTMQAGSTALDALEATGFTLDVQDSEYGKFVNAVNDLACEGTRGWIYTVNGEQVQISADKQELKAGDKLVWSYIDMAGSDASGSTDGDAGSDGSDSGDSDGDAGTDGSGSSSGDAGTDDSSSGEASSEE